MLEAIDQQKKKKTTIRPNAEILYFKQKNKTGVWSGVIQKVLATSNNMKTECITFFSDQEIWKKKK